MHRYRRHEGHGWLCHVVGSACLALSCMASVVRADELADRRSKVGVEFELETGASHAWQSRGVTLVPGVRLDHAWINMVEVLIEGAHEHELPGGERSFERKMGVRIRHEMPLGMDVRMVLRGLLGHAHQGDVRFWYAYVEPSVRYAFPRFEMMVGYRYVRAFEVGGDHDLHKFRIGPGIDLGECNELEFRWARSWSARTGQRVSDAYIVEYTRRF